MVTNHLRIISEHIGEYFQCCDYLLKEKETCKINVRVCVCVFGRGVCMRVYENLVMDILSHNKIAFQIAPKSEFGKTL